MRLWKRYVGWCFGIGYLIGSAGCVSLSEYQRLRVQHRHALAEKASLEQELFDVRTANDSLRTRLGSLEGEMAAKDELRDTLRKENVLLDDWRKQATSTLEDMSKNPALGTIALGSKLPEALHRALKRFADEHQVIVQYDAARGTVKWKGDLVFPTGSDVVKESSIGAMQEFAQVLMSPAASDFEVLVVGHTDAQPIVKEETKAKHRTNWHLSVHRAIAVGFALQKYGYQAERIGIMGYGEYRPVDDNSTESGKSQNRRVEMYLLPRGAIVQASAGTSWPKRADAVSAGDVTP